MGTKELEKLIYYESYVVVNPGASGLKTRELIPEDEYLRILSESGPDHSDLADDDPKKFVAMIGGEAV